MNKDKPVVVGRGTQLFNELRWLGKVINKDRDVWQVLHVEHTEDEIILVTTDGRRLHKVQTKLGTLCHPKFLPAGDYMFEKNNDKEVVLTSYDIQYPNWRRVTPEGNPEHFPKYLYTIDLKIPEYTTNDKSNFSVAFGQLTLLTDTIFDLRYIEAMADDDRYWTIKWYSKKYAFLFSNGIRHASIMSKQDMVMQEVRKL